MTDILKRTYGITRWAHWDDEIHAAVQDFRDRFTLAPNILLASEVTHARIDMAAKKENIRGPDGEAAPEGEHTPIGVFGGEGYQLEFCIDDQLPAGRFSLIHDVDPDGGGGEPVPDEDTEEAGAKISILAR
jgi:hypothetical protein